MVVPVSGLAYFLLLNRRYNNITTTITDPPNFAIYVCAMDTLHKSVCLTEGMRVGRCVSHVRDTTSV